MANHDIVIKGINSDGTLDLSDHGKTDANHKDTVTWKIKKESNVERIDSIVPKSTSINLFSKQPAPTDSTGRIWKGTIHSKLSGTEDYTIGWTAVGNTTPRFFDPKIQVKVKDNSEDDEKRRKKTAPKKRAAPKKKKGSKKVKK